MRAYVGMSVTSVSLKFIARRTMRLYLVPVEIAARACYGTLRSRPPKNAQHSKIRWAHDYLLATAQVSSVIRVGSHAVDVVTESGSAVPS